jgi:hypothetical protein
VGGRADATIGLGGARHGQEIQGQEVLGCSYADALTLFDGPGDDQCEGFRRHEMIAALAKGGKSYKLGSFGPLAQGERAEKAKPASGGEPSCG